MTIIEKAIRDIEAMHLRPGIQERILRIVEQACLDSEEKGEATGKREGLQECWDNPFEP